MTPHTAPTCRLPMALLATLAIITGVSACSIGSDQVAVEPTRAVRVDSNRRLSPSPPVTQPPTDTTPSTPPPSTTVVQIGTDFDELDPSLADVFREVFGPSTGALEGSTPPSPAPPTTAPPATAPPVTAPPETAPPVTEPTPVESGPPPPPVGSPVAAYASSVDSLIALWNEASMIVAESPDLTMERVVFDSSTFTTGPGFEDGSITVVGRDTTEQVFIGLHVDGTGEVLGLIVGGRAMNPYPLSAMLPLWLLGETDVGFLADAFLATVDAEAEDAYLPAADGGTWSIFDYGESVVFGKVQNGDVEAASFAIEQLTYFTLSVLPPL